MKITSNDKKKNIIVLQNLEDRYAPILQIFTGTGIIAKRGEISSGIPLGAFTDIEIVQQAQTSNTKKTTKKSSDNTKANNQDIDSNEATAV